MLAPNITVGPTAVWALASKPGTRQLRISNLGTGTLFYKTVPAGTAATLTTGNGTPVTGENPNVFVLGVVDPPVGFDVYLISGTSTTASVQTVPL